MIGLSRCFRALLACALLLCVGVPQAANLAPEVVRGYDWLGAQVQADGHLVGEAESIATPLQARSETLHTLAAAGRVTPALVDAVRRDAEVSTECQARRVVALAAANADVAPLASALRNNLAAGGGFAAEAGSPANALDTAFGLIGLKLAGAPRDTNVSQALNYLAQSASSDGGYGEGQRAYATAYALLALQRWRNDYDLSSAITRSRAALVALQANGAYSDSMENAIAAWALTAIGASGEAAAALNALRTSQSANGSWNNDPYVTALALRVLSAPAAAPVSGTTQFSGEILDGSSNLPLAGASVQVAGLANPVITGSDGRFVLGNVPAGDQMLRVTRSGYQTLERSVSLSSDVAFDIGRLALQPISGSAILRGVVTDSRDHLPQAGVTVALTGVVTTQTVTDENGRYEFVGLPAGIVTVTTSKAGYTGSAEQVELRERETLLFSTWVCPSGSQPPTGTEATLKGRIVRASDSAPLAGAAVVMGTLTTISDADGVFQFERVSTGPFAAEVRAQGYLNVALSGSLAPGVNDTGNIAMLPGENTSDPDSSTITGRLTSGTSTTPVAGVHVLIDGVEQAVSDENGDYRVSGVQPLRFALAFRAVGYAEQSLTTEVPAHGVYRIDRALVPNTGNDGSALFQVLGLSAQPGSVKPGDALQVSAQVAFLGEAERAAIVMLRIQDGEGLTVATACDNSGGSEQCEIGFGAQQTLNWSLSRAADNLPAGRYRLALHVVEPGSISRDNPLGTLLASGEQEIEILAQPSLTGSVNTSPPAVIPNSPSGVTFSAIARNDGNAAVPAGDLRLQVLRKGTTQVVMEKAAAMPQLQPNDVVDVDFGSWQPATGAEYDLVVTAADTSIVGRLTGALYVGDAAHGEFTVTPNDVADGTQTVSGRIAVTGVDHPTGAAADPLFTLVKAAVERGGEYTATQAKTWQNSHRCNGCHIQTQSLYGLASASEKADINFADAKYFYNSQAGLMHPDGHVDSHYPNWPVVQSTLALWGMGEWPDAAASFASRYRVAEYLLGRRQSNGDQTSWGLEYNAGWLNGRTAATATVLEGLGGVLRDADALGVRSIATVSEAARVPNVGQGAVDLTLGADGAVYVLDSSYRAVYRMDAESGALLSTISLPTATLGLIPVAIATAPDGSIYVATNTNYPAGATIARISGATVELVARLSVHLIDIDVRTDGSVGALTLNQTVLAISPAGGITTLASGSTLPRSWGTRMAAFSDGSLRIVAQERDGYLRIPSSGGIIVEETGLLQRLSDVAEGPDGAMLLQAGRQSGIVRVSRDGIAERLYGISSFRRIASNGDKTFVIGVDSALRELIGGSADLTQLDAMRAAVAGAARYHMAQGAPTSATNKVLAHTLIGLGEAVPFVSDAALASQIRQRMTDIAAILKSRQRSDGGFGYTANSSDPLETAIVGTALDYLAPTSDDPVLRKSVDYLLKTQKTDGSWSSGYFNLLGSTSYVVAYLPKAVSRLGGITVGLNLEFPENVVLSNPSSAPSGTEATQDGGTKYTFDLGRVTGSAFNVDFQLEMKDLLPLEHRAAATTASLSFRNGFNGELLTVPIEVPVVRAENSYSMSLALNRTEFYANESVDVQPTVRNDGSSYTDGHLRYFIESADGAVVAELSANSFSDFNSGTQQVISQQWNTGSTLAGDYVARVKLYGPEDTLLAEQTVPFRIAAGDGSAPLLSGQVSTDKAEYSPLEHVTIAGRVRNEASNVTVTGLTMTETVTGPSGDVVFRESAEITQLLPSMLADRTFTYSLGTATAGEYTIVQTVADANGNILDSRETRFAVLSTAQSGAGLSGALTATPSTVEQGESMGLAATVSNRGNADLSSLPLELAVIDPAQESILWQSEFTYDLPRDGSVALSQDWSTGDVAVGRYVAVLRARVGSGMVVLAQTSVTIDPPPVRAELQLEASRDNRLLALLTCRIGNGRAEDAACLSSRVEFVHALLTDMGVNHTIVTSTDAFRREFRSGRYNTYWISGGAEKLANSLAEELREAIFRGEGLLVDGSHDSRNQILDEALGVAFTGQLAGNDHRLFVAGETFGTSELAVPGDALRYQPAAAQPFGRFDSASGQAGLFTHDFGRGAGVLHAYDLVGALQGVGSSSVARSLLDRSLQRLLSHPRSSFVAGEFVEVTATVSNRARAADLALDLATPDAVILLTTAPAAFEASAHFAEWQFRLEEEAQLMFDAGVQMPDTTGAVTIDAAVLHRSAGGERTLDVEALALNVTARTLVQDGLQADLRGLNLSGAAERNARDRVLSYIQQAGLDIDGGRFESAIGALLRALDELAKVTSVSTADQRVAIAQLIGMAGWRWQPPAN